MVSAAAEEQAVNSNFAPLELEQSSVAAEVPDTPGTLMSTGPTLPSQPYTGSPDDCDLTASERGEKQQQPVVYEHEWQHSVYEGRKLPDGYRCAQHVRCMIHTVLCMVYSHNLSPGICCIALHCARYPVHAVNITICC